MPTDMLRPLVLPAALVMSSFVLGSGCSDDESTTTTTTTSGGLPSCPDVREHPECIKCLSAIHKRLLCAGTPNDPDNECFYDEDTDACDEMIA